MGLFSTTLSLYKKDQPEIVDALKKELKEKRHLTTFEKIDVNSENFQEKLDARVYSDPGAFYLVCERLDNWTTILELNVNLEDSFYLYEIGNSMSAHLNTYSLSFHLHDDDILLYNLDLKGSSVDAYNSHVQYFESQPLKRGDIIAQRQDPEKFITILPEGKTIGGLSEILDRGYWKAFDNGDLDNDGYPTDEKYDVDEEQRLKDLGCYLEIYGSNSFPFANWYSDIYQLNISKCYLLRADA
jgi:hypothetical protein